MRLKINIHYLQEQYYQPVLCEAENSFLNMYLSTPGLDRRNCIMRSFTIRIFHQDQIMAAVMGGTCGMHRKENKWSEGFSGEVDGKRPLRRPRHRRNNSHIRILIR